MEIGGAHQAHLERIGPDLGLNDQASAIGLANVAAVRRALDPRLGKQVIEDLEIGEFVAGRKLRRGLRNALVLGDLGQGFVQCAPLGVGFVDRTAVAHVPVEHQAAADIGVMRNGDDVEADCPGVFEIGPKVLRLAGVGGGERRGSVVVSEDDVAVQVVFSLRHGRPFIGDEGRKASGFIVGVGGIHLLVPGRLHRL